MIMTYDYCICGMADEDPLHAGWHHVYAWNLDVLGRETIRRHKVFDQVYGHEFKAKPDPAINLLPF